MSRIYDILKRLAENIPADYIIDYGIEGSWTWEKWKSGRATASTLGKTLTTPNLTMNTIGNVFYSNPIAIEVPSIFLEGSLVSMSFGGTTSEQIGFTMNQRTITNGIVRIRSIKAINATKPVTFTMTIEGIWKELETIT